MEIDWQTGAAWGIYMLVVICWLAGFVLSCLSLSGTWLVWLGGILLHIARRPDFPGLTTLIILLFCCIAVELLEFMAGAWGVQRRGGSKASGRAALIGGFIGLLAGSLIPIPLIGSLIGMLAGSFLCAFLVERAAMKKTEHAAHIATGAVLARLGVVFLKVGVTLAMILILMAGWIASAHSIN